MVRLDVGTTHLVLCERPPLPIHPKFWKAVGLSVRDADVMVQKNFFHYRIFYLSLSFHHVPVKTDGATSFERIKARTYDVPVYPTSDPKGWRESDPLMRRASTTAPDGARASA